MAYADFTFYTDNFYGDTLTETDAEKWLELASDELDAITFGRLTSAFPTENSHVVKIKKAVCAIADALYKVDIQRRAVSAQQTADGTYRGAIASISSGSESISYSVNGAASTSIYASAAADTGVQTVLLYNLAAKYLANIPDANGVNLLYAGVMSDVENNCG